LTRPDVGAIAGSVWMPALLWLLLVIFATVDGYPGAVCVTPVAWLTAANTGQRCVTTSRSPRPVWPLAEAGLAGVTLGLWQGLVMMGVGLWGGGIPQVDRSSVVLASVVIGGLGAVVCGLLAVAVGALQLRRLS
jgi:hypothetical protein